MNLLTRRVLFLLFFLSGFSGLVYQVVWTRLAFASFGIITPVLSVVLSVFMLGLAVGSWIGGRWIGPLVARTGWSAAIFYAGAEFIIGLGAFVVPKLFSFGENVLLASGGTNSFGYLSLSAVVLAISILPWCVCMGTTFPFMMAYIREREHSQTGSFSFLYLANVLGAMCGTFFAAVVFIELFGFHRTLWVAAAGNFTITLISVCLGIGQKQSQKAGTQSQDKTPAPATAATSDNSPCVQRGFIKSLLFSTGLISMAMEVVWTRAFTPVLKTQVYSFAAIVFTYLGATFLGSWFYRQRLRANRVGSKSLLVAMLAIFAFFPVIANNPAYETMNFTSPAIDGLSALLLLFSIVPFCALLGYLTPSLIDEYAGGDPQRGGRAYAINVVGCILGPLLACYVVLPHISERYVLVFLTLPFIAFFFLLKDEISSRLRGAFPVIFALALLWATAGTEDFEGWLKRTNSSGAVVRRDYMATVISYGEGWRRMLLVNGFGMTMLTPITKFMVHLPMAFHRTPPKSALVICFGMGTSFRSAVSWDVDTTTVELVPSVTKAFGYYHSDAASFINATNGHIITDDGRRFLKRTTQKFDVIVVDPPPPVQASGSSLLFSKEFYALAKQRLAPGGILQMWVPGDAEHDTAQAIFRSMHESFPYMRCFNSISGWGVHMLGSMEPIERFDADQLVTHMPERAQHDLLEWFDPTNTPAVLDQILTHEISITNNLNPDKSVQVTDDKPFNEYYLLRAKGWKMSN